MIGDLISVIVPARNECNQIQRCIQSLIGQDFLEHGKLEIIVVANGCHDRTAELARDLIDISRSAGADLHVIEVREAGKHLALNVGDALATGDIRVYLDADVSCASDLVSSLARALSTPTARYASGTLSANRSMSWITRRYSEFWSILPFIAEDVPGVGLYAVNKAGRARWSTFPAIHSDDKFVRLHFHPDERIRVQARYEWPLPEGVVNLIRVRRRWCEGNRELRRRYPTLFRGDMLSAVNVSRLRLSRLIGAPISGLVFLLVYASAASLALFTPATAPVVWRRGRP